MQNLAAFVDLNVLSKIKRRRVYDDGIDSQQFYDWLYHGSVFVLYGSYRTNNTVIRGLEISLSVCCGINNLLLGQGVRQLVFYSLAFMYVKFCLQGRMVRLKDERRIQEAGRRSEARQIALERSRAGRTMLAMRMGWDGNRRNASGGCSTFVC